jgi:hypothetical protein
MWQGRTLALLLRRVNYAGEWWRVLRTANSYTTPVINSTTTSFMLR